MPLSKVKQAEWMREYRKRGVIPKSDALQSKSKPLKSLLSATAPPVIPSVIPGEDIVSQVKRLYPDGHLPNCLDGRYRPYSKEEQVKVLMPKAQVNKKQANSNLNPVQPTRSIKGLIMEGNRIIGVQPKVPSPSEGEVNIPLYNPAIHRLGDRVLIKPPYGKKLIETVIPEIDAEGNPIYREG